MKSIITSLLVCINLVVFAQNIPNNDFENWSQHQSYEEPASFNTSNLFSYIATGQSNATKVTDATDGNYAIRLETKISGDDTLFGFLSNAGLFSNGPAGGAAYPFSTAVDTISFQAKYDIQPQDTAVFFVGFQLQGSMVAMGFMHMTGAQSTYELKNLPITWMTPMTVMPDTMMFAVVSSNPDYAPKDGSWLQIDDIKGDGQGFTNSSFETWNSIGYEDADHWSTFNVYGAFMQTTSVEKSTDAYSGSYAIKLTTRIFNNGDDTIAHFSNGRLLDDDFMGGMKIYANPVKVTGYYKYSPVGNDSALVALRAYAHDNSGTYQNVDNNIIKLGAASTYTYFEIPLTYNSWPTIDTLGIAFASSNIFDGRQWVKAGSELLIDSLNIVYQTVGIDEEEATGELNVYPVPAQNEIHFELPTPSESMTVSIYNTSGKLVKQERLSQSTLNVSELVNGLYFYTIESENKLYNGKISILR